MSLNFKSNGYNRIMSQPSDLVQNIYTAVPTYTITTNAWATASGIQKYTINKSGLYFVRAWFHSVSHPDKSYPFANCVLMQDDHGIVSQGIRNQDATDFQFDFDLSRMIFLEEGTKLWPNVETPIAGGQWDVGMEMYLLTL